jgi:AsmA protein
MPKIAKYILTAVGALIVIILIAIAIIAATFNPNDYKPMIIKMVQEKKQRTLAIPGDIKLTFFPKIGVDLGKVSLSEHANPAEFASITSARVSLAFWPLLSKHAVVDQISVDGINVNLKRNKDGTFNFDDLLTKPDATKEDSAKDESGKAASSPVNFNIDSVHIGKAHVLFDDQQQNRKVELVDVNLDTGEIANNVPSKATLTAGLKNNQPKVDVTVSVKTGFTFDLDQKHYTVKGLDAVIKGALLDFTDVNIKAAGNADIKLANQQFALDGISLAASAKQANQALEAKFDVPNLVLTQDKATGGKISGEAKVTEGTQTMVAQLSAPSFEGTSQMFKLPDLVLTLDGKQGDAAIGGKLTTNLSADLKNQLMEFSKIVADFNLSNPNGGSIKLKADGQASLNLEKQSVAMTLKGSLDDSAFDAKVGIAKFAPLALNVDIGIDKLDIDRFLGKPAAQPAEKPVAGKPEPEKPIDLSALKTLNAKGNLRIGALKVMNVKSSNVHVGLNADNGKVEINPLSANLYEGSTAGSITLMASATPHIAIKQNLTGINIGPLLKDAMDKQLVDGKGNVQLDINTQGALVSQMKKALAGSAQMELRDGSLHGINIAQTIRNAKAKLGGGSQQSGTGTAGDKTDFSELKASFKIAKGIAHNDDLSAKSPLIRVGGAGDINVGEDRLDYLVKATVVTTLQGQGGPELQALKGLTVPVKLSGPFTAIEWKVDFGSLVTDAAKQKVETKKEEVKSKAKEELKKGLKGLLGK